MGQRLRPLRSSLWLSVFHSKIIPLKCLAFGTETKGLSTRHRLLLHVSMQHLACETGTEAACETGTEASTTLGLSPQVSVGHFVCGTGALRPPTNYDIHFMKHIVSVTVITNVSTQHSSWGLYTARIFTSHLHKTPWMWTETEASTLLWFPLSLSITDWGLYTTAIWIHFMSQQNTLQVIQLDRDRGLYVYNTMNFTPWVNNTPCKTLSLTGTEASMYTTLWQGTVASMYTTLWLSLHKSITHPVSH